MRISDWSSDVCSSDLAYGGRWNRVLRFADQARNPSQWAILRHRRSGRSGTGLVWTDQNTVRPSVDRTGVVQGKSVPVRVALGGRRIIKNTQHTNISQPHHPATTHTPPKTPTQP